MVAGSRRCDAVDEWTAFVTKTGEGLRARPADVDGDIDLSRLLPAVRDGQRWEESVS